MQPNRQTGAATLMGAVLLLTLITLMVVVALEMSRSSVGDSAMLNDGHEAFFLAESGIEVATKNWIDGVPCDGSLAQTLVLDSRRTIVIEQGFATDFDGITALPVDQCRIRARGEIATLGVVQVAEYIAADTGGGSTQIEYQFPSDIGDFPTSGPASGGYPYRCNNTGNGSLSEVGNTTWDSGNNAPGSVGGSFRAQLWSWFFGGSRIHRGYREATLPSTIVAGSTVDLSLYFAKIMGNASRVQNHHMYLDLVATDGTNYRLWCNEQISDFGWTNATTLGWIVPAGKTIDRIRIGYYFRVRRARNLSEFFATYGWWDAIQLTIN
ncbi:MAG TPA: hypothetical protein DCZ03_03335 [Gammaproteobacteria bacterium]|nr:hypothetical protein [Gammaproteobacteria bacterium]